MSDAKPLRADDPRWLVEPHFSPVRRYDTRNSTGIKRDGWVLTDTVTDARRRYDTKKDANQYVDNVLSRETGVDWARVAAWSCPALHSHRPGTTLGEVGGLDADGMHISTLGVVSLAGDENEVRDRINRLLGHLDHPYLPERVR